MSDDQSPYGEPQQPQPQYGQPRPEHGQPQQPQPQSGQPQYGQTPPQYGQPQYGQPQYGQPQSPYGQTPPQYGQPQSGYQAAYGQQAYDVTPPGLYSAPAPQKSGMLGLIGLGLVLVSGIALLIVAWMIGSAFGEFMVQIGINTIDPNDPTLQSDPRFIAFGEQVAGQVGFGWFAVLFGFAGWVVSIVATAVKRGRNMGIIGIVLGIVFPIAAFFVLFAGIMPALSTMTN